MRLTTAALVAASVCGVASFSLYWSTLPFGVEEASDGWNFGPPLNHPWAYRAAVLLGILASMSLLGGLVGIIDIVRRPK